jgi:hypothetical protein
MLLAKGANVHQGAVAIHDYLCDERGNRLLSCRHSTLSPQAGINHVTTIHHGTTPLYLAAEDGHFAVVKVLVANCANVNQGALAIHDYLSNVNEGIAYCPSTTSFHLRKQAETMALLHCTWLPQMETWRLCCCCLPRVRTSTKVQWLFMIICAMNEEIVNSPSTILFYLRKQPGMKVLLHSSWLALVGINRWCIC